MEEQKVINENKLYKSKTRPSTYFRADAIDEGVFQELVVQFLSCLSILEFLYDIGSPSVLQEKKTM